MPTIFCDTVEPSFRFICHYIICVLPRSQKRSVPRGRTDAQTIKGFRAQPPGKPVRMRILQLYASTPGTIQYPSASRSRSRSHSHSNSRSPSPSHCGSGAVAVARWKILPPLGQAPKTKCSNVLGHINASNVSGPGAETESFRTNV